MSKFQRGQAAQFIAGESDQGLYLLPQLQSTINFCVLAAEELEELGLSDGEGLEHVSAVLESTWEFVRQARDELYNRSKASFPQSAPPAGVFRPDLPPELALEAQVHRGNLIVSAYALGPATATKSDTEISPELGVGVGQVVQYRGQRVEVLEMVEHRYEILQLQIAVDAVERAWIIISRTRDHLVAFVAAAAYDA